MNEYPLDHYAQWPFAKKAVIFLKAAKVSYNPRNRYTGFWDAAYYLLSHAVELSIKAVAQLKTGKEPKWIHDKETLAQKYQRECSITKQELDAIKKLKDLNEGKGGLRYDNRPKGEFFPSVFENNVKIVERLLDNFSSTKT